MPQPTINDARWLLIAKGPLGRQLRIFITEETVISQGRPSDDTSGPTIGHVIRLCMRRGVAPEDIISLEELKK